LGTSHQDQDGRPSGPRSSADEAFEVWLKNSPEEPRRVRDILDSFAARHQIAPKILHAIEVAVEEHLTNVISYAYDDPEEHQIQLRISLKETVLELQIVDDGKPFNPLDHPLPDTHLPLEEKPLGGLGILLIRKMMDHLAYTRAGKKNVFTLRKRIPLPE
jgi:anti-sigma regulatory factor (Ser/Thr protein kinase)